jgi:hypothetical protein
MRSITEVRHGEAEVEKERWRRKMKHHLKMTFYESASPIFQLRSELHKNRFFRQFRFLFFFTFLYLHQHWRLTIYDSPLRRGF